MPIRRPPEPVERVAWSDWFPYFARNYRIGPTSADHVTIIGPTGTGKTTIAMAIASLRRYVVAIGTKPSDPDFRKLLVEQGFRFQSNGELPSAAIHPKVAVWPDYTGRADRPDQLAAFEQVFDIAFARGGWHIVAEELNHLVDLGMRRQVSEHYRAARTSVSGIIGCAQRPVDIPKLAISGAQHLIIFGTNDPDDLKHLGGINGLDPWRLRYTVANLGRSYDFVHVDVRSGNLTVSKYDQKAAS